MGQTSFALVHIFAAIGDFLQQSEYTICVSFENIWRFEPHENLFNDTYHEDFLTKITIPCTERLKVLALLDDHNLNAFSLFASEESLMDTMAFRALDCG